MRGVLHPASVSAHTRPHSPPLAGRDWRPPIPPHASPDCHQYRQGDILFLLPTRPHPAQYSVPISQAELTEPECD